MKHLLTVLVLALVMANAFVAASPRHSHDVKSRGYKYQRQKGVGRKVKGNGHSTSAPPPPPPPPQSDDYDPHSRTFDITSFGAKGDGVTDDSKALQAAWRAACVVPSATIKIPSESKFLIRPIDGTILASSQLGDWSKSTLLQWVNFKWLNEFTITGSGTVDGQGSAWWNMTQDHHHPKVSNCIHIKMHEDRCYALRFYGSCNVTVRDIRILNSPQCHLKFDSSEGVKVTNITISSPGSSPNTDGIHIQQTQDVQIEHSDIGCGDDCVSIQAGCSNVHVHNINCGPGHGISLGGLGKDNSLACVSNITVEDVSIRNALYGVRIKTWQGGIGSVRNVTFTGVQVSEVETPIVIDQYYCNKKSCKNQTDAIAITGVKYKQITGTYSWQPMHIACSDSTPCTNVDLVDVQLSPSSDSASLHDALCWKSYGDSKGLILPFNIDCLQRGNKLFRALESHKYSC
ncbi:hypothetical protein Taro_004913 [Colocasia esculenta]|uniref:Polygalacturonase n=1 Tax=Colocasia esculenta TaxID=4460 RepID=A0A843TQZ4_COLES|nr:hypothetical protein [Colocasia esculenta]